MHLISHRLQKRIEQLTVDPPQAILFEGIVGYSTSYEASLLAQALYEYHPGTTVQAVEKPEDKTVIGLEQIQQLYRQTRHARREGYSVWLINNAHYLSEEAQDAFLKLLEEPPRSVIFILSLGQADSVLRTIQSRCLKLQSLPVEDSTGNTYLQRIWDIGDATVRQQLLFLASGSADELVRLARDSSYRQSQLDAAANAKKLINGEVFEKIQLVAVLASDRQKAITTVDIALKMLLALATRQAQDRTFSSQLALLSQVHERLAVNGNIRAQLLLAALPLN